MYLIDTDYSPAQSTFRSRPQKPLLLLQEFLRQGKPVMEVVFTRYEYRDAGSCRATFAKAIKYHHLESLVSVRSQGRKVYLVREESNEQ